MKGIVGMALNVGWGIGMAWIRCVEGIAEEVLDMLKVYVHMVLLEELTSYIQTSNSLSSHERVTFIALTPSHSHLKHSIHPPTNQPTLPRLNSQPIQSFTPTNQKPPQKLHLNLMHPLLPNNNQTMQRRSKLHCR